MISPVRMSKTTASQPPSTITTSQATETPGYFASSAIGAQRSSLKVPLTVAPAASPVPSTDLHGLSDVANIGLSARITVVEVSLIAALCFSGSGDVSSE